MRPQSALVALKIELDSRRTCSVRAHVNEQRVQVAPALSDCLIVEGLGTYQCVFIYRPKAPIALHSTIETCAYFRLPIPQISHLF